jgi:hypothetical protein
LIAYEIIYTVNKIKTSSTPTLNIVIFEGTIHTSYEHGLKYFILYRVFGVSVATQTYIFLNGTPSIFLRFLKALVKTKRKIRHLMGLTSTVSKLFALLCPDKPNFENL